MPFRRILPPDADRTYMELDPDAVDTRVVSLHKGVSQELMRHPYEMAALVWLALAQTEVQGSDQPTIKNILLAWMLAPLNFLASQEIFEAVDRLTARGFVQQREPGHFYVDPVAIRVLERRELPARFLMEWNAAKAKWPGPVPPRMETAPH
ncbi:hypothetical protein [Streptomyces noursei]|uniref:hypothetical protein n=1 Tax=Streptomyces noursei TaxID=1971 RepID=UPI001674AE32|nr:hypothetical protein [Streptomyces noursei]MCZ1020309.1 hypothetical protein [Streptomyces noursei]